MIKGRTPFRACGPFLYALLLCACEQDTRPSADEGAALDEAEALLNAAPDTLANIDENALGEGGSAPDNQLRGEEPR